MKDDEDDHNGMQDDLLEDQFDLHVGENDNDPLEAEAHGDHEDREGKKDAEHHEAADSKANRDCYSVGVLRGEAWVVYRGAARRDAPSQGQDPLAIHDHDPARWVYLNEYCQHKEDNSFEEG